MIKNNFFFISVITIILIILFFPVLFQNKYIFDEDIRDLFAPCKITIDKAFKNKEIPLWTEYRFGGHPFIEETQSQLFYPIAYLFIFFKYNLAINLSIIFHLILTMIFFIRLGKSLKLSKSASFFGGLLFILSGFIAQSYKDGNLGIITTVTWLPLIISEIINYINFKNKKFLTIAIISNVLMFLAGHFQFFYIAQYAIFLIFLLYQNKNYSLKSNIKSMIVFYVFTLGIILFQFLPLLKYAFESSRINASYHYSTVLSLSPDQIILFFLNNFFGFDEYTFWGPNTTLWLGYTGWFIICLLIVTYKNKFPLKKYLIFLIFIGIFLAAGKFNPLYKFLFNIIPGINKFRAPQRFLFLYIFAISIWTMFNIDYFFSKNIKLTKKQKIFFSTIIFISAIIIFFAIFFKTLLFSIIIYLYKVIKFKLHFSGDWLNYHITHGLNPNTNLIIIKSLLIFISINFIFLITFTIKQREPNKKNYIYIIFIIALCFELIPTNKILLNFSLHKIQDFKKHTKSFNIIKSDKTNFRIDSTKSCGFFEYFLYDLKDIFGRSATISKKYYNFRKTINSDLKYNLLNVKYLFTNKKNNNYKLLYKENNSFLYLNPNSLNLINPIKKIYLKKEKNILKFINSKHFNYKNNAVLPKKYKDDFINYVFSDDLKISNIKQTFNSLSFKVISNTNSNFIFISKQYDKYWKAYNNDKNITVYNTNYLFNGLYLKNKINNIKLIYVPTYFYISIIISIIFIICLIVWYKL